MGVKLITILDVRTCLNRGHVEDRTTVAAPTTHRAAAVATTARPTGKLQFTLQQTREALGDAVEQFTVNTKEAKRLPTLKKAVNVLEPTMVKFHQEHQAYKFQIAVDPAIVTQLPVVLTSEMVAVYSDAVPPLDDVNRQLLKFIEVYEQNGSGWVFSKFVSTIDIMAS